MKHMFFTHGEAFLFYFIFFLRQSGLRAKAQRKILAHSRHPQCAGVLLTSAEPSGIECICSQ